MSHDTLENQLRSLDTHEGIRELLAKGGVTATVVDALIDTFAGWASMGDDEVGLIGNLGDILCDAMDQVNDE